MEMEQHASPTREQNERNPPGKNKATLGQIWRNFLSETTFHGCRNMDDRRRSGSYRVLWTCMVLGMLASLLYILTLSLSQYFEYKVDTKSRLEVLSEMPFPAITVCSTSTLNTSGKNISQTVKDYIAKGTLLGFLYPPVNWSDPDSRELEQTTIKYYVDEMTIPDMKQFIRYYEWKGSGNMTFNPVITVAGKCYVANTDFVHQAKATTEGREGGLEMILNIQEQGIIMQGDMTSGAMIFVHDPRERARIMASGVMVAPGYSFYVGVKSTKYKFLPAPYRSYGRSYCLETNETYSHEACVSEWTSSQTAKYCNCTSGIEPVDLLETLPSCSLRQFAECYQFTYDSFQESSLQDNFTECPRPCSFSTYDTSMSFSKFPSAPAAEKMIYFSKKLGFPNPDLHLLRRNLIKVTVFFDRFYMEYVEHEAKVTFNSIFSMFGGQMGFFLGASFLTVIELFDALWRSCWPF